MPNWVANTLEIAGPAEDISRFVRDLRAKSPEDPCSILETWLPTPPSLKPEVPVMLDTWQIRPIAEQRPETLAWYEQNSNWYEWRLDHWGCKWADDSRLDEVGERKLVLRGETPWAPYDAGLVSISRMFPTLTFLHSAQEEAFDFFGTKAVKNGEVIGEETADGSAMPYDCEPEDVDRMLEDLRAKVLKELPADVREIFEDGVL